MFRKQVISALDRAKYIVEKYKEPQWLTFVAKLANSSQNINIARYYIPLMPRPSFTFTQKDFRDLAAEKCNTYEVSKEDKEAIAKIIATMEVDSREHITTYDDIYIMGTIVNRPRNTCAFVTNSIFNNPTFAHMLFGRVFRYSIYAAFIMHPSVVMFDPLFSCFMGGLMSLIVTGFDFPRGYGQAAAFKAAVDINKILNEYTMKSKVDEIIMSFDNVRNNDHAISRERQAKITEEDLSTHHEKPEIYKSLYPENTYSDGKSERVPCHGCLKFCELCAPLTEKKK